MRLTYETEGKKSGKNSQSYCHLMFRSIFLLIWNNIPANECRKLFYCQRCCLHRRLKSNICTDCNSSLYFIWLRLCRTCVFLSKKILCLHNLLSIFGQLLGKTYKFVSFDSSIVAHKILSCHYIDLKLM